MTKEELHDMLEEHKKWLNNQGGKRADLRDADLSGADLRDTDIRGAYLSGANLRNADLIDADLSGADLSSADLRDANIRGAYLSGTDLRDADIRGADLRDADIRGAYLSDADLRDTDLRDTDIRGTYLSGANLRDADISGANLRDADLKGAKNVPYIPLSCPSDGAFIGWKKVKGKIVKLQILEDSRRSSATTNKCRCDKALVLDIDGGITEITSYTYKQCTYKVGDIVYADSWDEDRWNECSHGIHFFINKQDAIDY